MRDYLILFLLSYCVGCWIASILAIIDGQEEYKKRFGTPMIPTAVVIGILSPILLIVSVMLSVSRFLMEKLKR